LRLGRLAIQLGVHDGETLQFNDDFYEMLATLLRFGADAIARVLRRTLQQDDQRFDFLATILLEREGRLKDLVLLELDLKDLNLAQDLL
jgi:hypothetical protein